MTDFNEIMKQARQMKEQLEQAQRESLSRLVEGESGAGLVKVEMNGRHDVRQVKIDASLLQEDIAVVEDLVAAAVNDAVRKVEESNKEAMSGMAGAFNLPEGFRFP